MMVITGKLLERTAWMSCIHCVYPLAIGVAAGTAALYGVKNLDVV